MRMTKEQTSVIYNRSERFRQKVETISECLLHPMEDIIHNWAVDEVETQYFRLVEDPNNL